MAEPRQTIKQRVAEVRKVVESINQGLSSGRIRVKIGPKGGVTFPGITEAERGVVTDGCIYRRIMVSGSERAKAAIARAEELAGRTVDRRAVSAGVNSDDGGTTCHDGH